MIENTEDLNHTLPAEDVIKEAVETALSDVQAETVDKPKATIEDIVLVIQFILKVLDGLAISVDEKEKIAAFREVLA